MQDQTENTKRIAKNTIMLYIRMLFGMLVSLYSSRIILDALGVVDYGIYNIVGGFVAMFSIVSSALSGSVSRFLTVELGKGNMDSLKKVFSTSLIIHLAMAIVIVILAETVGIWFLNNKMTIPSDRLYAANWVFQASVLAFIFKLFSVPFNASIISHEHMGAFAYIGIFDIMMKFLIILAVAYTPWHFDRLIVYSILLLLLGISLQFIYMTYCRKHFEECRLKLEFRKEYWKEMSAFAGWNFIGSTAGLLKDQGVNLLFNLFSGPVLNAARGIASTVNTVIVAFSANFMTALNPQITKSFAAGEHDYTFSLINRGSRFSFFIMMFFAIPMILETDFVLDLWLKEYPPHTVDFVRLVLLLSLSDIISNTLITLQLATGKIRNYQLAVGGVLLLNFPLSYIALKNGCAPEATYLIAIAISVACMVLRLVFLRKMAHLNISRFLSKVYLKIAIVFITSLIIPLSIHLQLDYGWARFLIVGSTSVVTSALSIYILGCTHGERKFINRKVHETFHKHHRK